MARRLLRWVLRGVGLLALLLCLAVPGSHSTPVWNAQAPLPLDVAIRVGNVNRFSARDKTYSIEGVLRITAPAEAIARLRDKGIEPIELVRFSNQIEPWNSLMEPDSGEVKDGGSIRHDYRFTGEFYSDQLNYRGYPFGALPLKLTLVPVPSANGAIRAYPFDSSFSNSNLLPLSLKIRADQRGSSVSRSSNMDGYRLQKWRFVSNADGIELQLIYNPIGWASLVKWLLPLAITMSVMLLTPNLLASFTAERLAIPPVILLTLVFMQQAYRESLPSLPYLTVLDTLYAFSYVVTLAFFCEFIWRANLLQRKRRIDLKAMERIELTIQLASLGGYGALMVWALTIT